MKPMNPCVSSANCEQPLHAYFFAIDRHRMGTDGKGITTLVCFMDCPLKCAYCINPECHGLIYKNEHELMQGVSKFTPQELYDYVKIDNLYFQITGGGICFGGGEPSIHSDFIAEFRRICGPKWKITLETALNCSRERLTQLAPVIDHWIIDIKDLHTPTYEAYTHRQSYIKEALQVLYELGLKDKVTLKVPLIPGYNDEQHVEQSIQALKRFGFKEVVKVVYQKTLNPEEENEKKEEKIKRQEVRIKP